MNICSKIQCNIFISLDAVQVDNNWYSYFVFYALFLLMYKREKKARIS